MSRLIVISNRVSAPRADSATGAQGGLAVALAAALRDHDGLWFGWSGEKTERFTGDIAFHSHGGVTSATIDLEEQDVEEYYNGYANRTLWPLFHYRSDLAEYDRSFAGGYERVNDLDSRLPPHPARPAIAPARRQEPDRLLPPQSLAAGAPDGVAALPRGAGPLDARL